MKNHNNNIQMIHVPMRIFFFFKSLMHWAGLTKEHNITSWPRHKMLQIQRMHVRDTYIESWHKRWCCNDGHLQNHILQSWSLKFHHLQVLDQLKYLGISKDKQYSTWIMKTMGWVKYKIKLWKVVEVTHHTLRMGLFQHLKSFRWWV